MIRILREHIPEAIREALAVRQLLERLGFMGDEFFVQYFGPARSLTEKLKNLGIDDTGISGVFDVKQLVTVKLCTQNKEYEVACGCMESWCDAETFGSMWILASNLWNGNAPGMVMSGTTRYRIYEESEFVTSGGSKKLVEDLRFLGIRLNLTVHPKGAVLGG